MKVLLCHNYYQQRGGEDESFDDEVALLRANGHDVLLYTLHNDDIEGMGRFEVLRNSLWNQKVYDDVRQIIRRERPDLLHCTNTFPLMSSSPLHAAHDERIPVVQALRNYRMHCINSLFLRDGKVCEDCLGKKLAWRGIVHGCYRDRASSAVVAGMSYLRQSMQTWSQAVNVFFTLTEFARQKFIAGGMSPDRIMVKPNFVFPDPMPDREQRCEAVFVGRLSTEKGIECLLEAWSKLSAPVQLKIIGDGPCAALVRQASERDSRIQWLGRLPREEVLEIVGKAMCLVMPSIWYETFGRTMMEAFAKGTPVIASRLGAMSEVVRDGCTGLHFKPGDAQDLANKIEQMCGDPIQRLVMRRTARMEYEARYTSQRNHELLLSIYQRAMGHRNDSNRVAEPAHSPIG